MREPPTNLPELNHELNVVEHIQLASIHTARHGVPPATGHTVNPAAGLEAMPTSGLDVLGRFVTGFIYGEGGDE